MIHAVGGCIVSFHAMLHLGGSVGGMLLPKKYLRTPTDLRIP